MNPQITQRGRAATKEEINTEVAEAYGDHGEEGTGYASVTPFSPNELNGY